jgi:hypothetical protein
MECNVCVTAADNLVRLCGVCTGEIGIHHGRLFFALAQTVAARERLVALDIFEWQQMNIDASGAGDKRVFLDHAKRLGFNHFVHSGLEPVVPNGRFGVSLALCLPFVLFCCALSAIEF